MLHILPSKSFVFRLTMVLFLICSCKTISQLKLSNEPKWSDKTAFSIINSYPKAWQIDGDVKPKWDYKTGFVLLSFEKLYQKTNNSKYLNYIKEYTDEMIDSSGTIAGYNEKEYNIDLINPGKILFDLYTYTSEERYLNAINQLRNQLKNQPRTVSRGFWHKEIYPNQMWLDGIYMAEPFYARYTIEYEKGAFLDDIAKQFELVHNYFVDNKTGLLFHAWDESKQIAWTNKTTGTSPTIWSRGIGWYMMALVDVLDYFPKNHPKQKVLVGYLNEMATTLMHYKTPLGLWYQVTDKPMLEGNYVEPSASAMFIYAFAKGTNKAYLPAKFKKQAKKSFESFLHEFVKSGKNGEVNIINTSPNVGLGGNPFRDGSNEFYVNGKKKDNGSSALAAFILCSIELDK